MSFRNNVLKLMSGVVIVQIVQFLSQPIITRIFTPAEFGQFSAISSIISLIASFGVLSYEFAIPALKDDQQAIDMSYMLILLAIPVSVLIGLVLSIEMVQIKLFGFYLSILWYLLPILLFAGIVANVVLYLNNRYKLFGLNAKRSVICAVISVCLQITLGYMGYGLVGLIIAFVTSSAVGMIVLITPKLKEILFKSRINLKILKDNIHFPKHQFTGGIINMSSQILPVVILNAFASNTIAGNYALAVKVLTIPVMLITGTFSHVFYQEFANRYNNNEDCLGFVINVWKKLFYLSAPICIFLAIFAPKLFSWYFGARWGLSGQIVQILSLTTFAAIMVSSTSSAFMIIGLSKYFILLTSTIAIFRFVGIYIACSNIFVGLWFMVLSELVFRLFFNLCIYFRLLGVANEAV